MSITLEVGPEEIKEIAEDLGVPLTDDQAREVAAVVELAVDAVWPHPIMPLVWPALVERGLLQAQPNEARSFTGVVTGRARK